MREYKMKQIGLWIAIFAVFATGVTAVAQNNSNTTDLENAKLVGDEVINTTYG
jgi:hypothetical protein